jgi:hypothetical protein
VSRRRPKTVRIADAAPFGCGVGVGVIVGVALGVALRVTLGVIVGVAEGVLVGVPVCVFVEVSVGASGDGIKTRTCSNEIRRVSSPHCEEERVPAISSRRCNRLSFSVRTV